MSKNIAIIGGGISGITTAIKLAKNRNNIINIYEKKDDILKGSPYCHLHAGGFLYPEISLKDSQILLNDCILFAKEFSECIEHRPTIVAYNINSKYNTSELIFKCKAIKLSYINSKCYILGEPDKFYEIYEKSDIEYYKKHGKMPYKDNVNRRYHDKYVEYFCKFLDDINKIKYPFISVCEPGINQDKVELKLRNELEKYNNIKIFTNKEVGLDELKKNGYYNCIINASGKDIYNINKDEKYEFKSSWIINMPLIINNFPEIAIIGERETKNGMIQITPLSSHIFQIHCMTSESTIIETYDKNSYKIHNLKYEEINKRGSVAIKEIAKYFPIFYLSKVKGARYGVQRIPYNSKLKRLSYIKTIKDKDKKRCIDIITLKACSIISLTNRIIEEVDGV